MSENRNRMPRGLGDLLAMLMGGSEPCTADNCVCRRGGRMTAAEWRDRSLKDNERQLEALKLQHEWLESKATMEDGKQIMSLEICALVMPKSSDPTVFQVIAAYGTDDGDDYTVLHEDGRTMETKTYNVHGVEAIYATIDSIKSKLSGEAEELNEKMKAAASETKPAEAPLQ